MQPDTHTISQDKSGVKYLLRNGRNMTCLHDRRPYWLKIKSGEEKLVHTYCTSSCPAFHCMQEEDKTMVCITCTPQETVINIDNVSVPPQDKTNDQQQPT